MEITFQNQLLADLYEGKKVIDKRFKSNPALVKQYIKTVINYLP
jgi:proteic killer suppression protein